MSFNVAKWFANQLATCNLPRSVQGSKSIPGLSEWKTPSSALRDCWSPHESIWARFPHFQQIDEIRNCAFEGPSAFQLCRCAMRLLPHPRINQSKARIHSNGNSFFCCDECTPWAFLCSCINQSKARNPFPVNQNGKHLPLYVK